MAEQLTKYKPGVPRDWLQLVAGLLWCGVGLLLLRWSWIWTSRAGFLSAVPYLVIGILGSAASAYFFRWMASQNIGRIQSLPEGPCLFAFQSWRSYPLVIFMMGLGIILRTSPLPRTWLLSSYLAIGGGLFLAGLTYFASLLLSDHRFPS
jgi:hypothetical protein